jgi:glyoxylase I family protein
MDDNANGPARVRGSVHHADLTVLDPGRSLPFYRAVLEFLGYRLSREDARGFDFDLHLPDGGYSGIGIVKATGEGVTRAHDRYSPGLHHLAFRAGSRADVDQLHELLVRMGATILDRPADYPEYGAGYYAVFFADPDGLKLELVHKP